MKGGATVAESNAPRALPMYVPIHFQHALHCLFHLLLLRTGQASLQIDRRDGDIEGA